MDQKETKIGNHSWNKTNTKCNNWEEKLLKRVKKHGKGLRKMCIKKAKDHKYYRIKDKMTVLEDKQMIILKIRSYP
jgi:hypothetical protein